MIHVKTFTFPKALKLSLPQMEASIIILNSEKTEGLNLICFERILTKKKLDKFLKNFEC